MTGWRLGYATADARWMPTMAHFHDLTYVCAPAPFQHGAAAGLEQLPPSFYKQVAADHQGKRERLLSALRTAGMEAAVPPGAYYVLAQRRGCRARSRRKRRGICWRRQALLQLRGRRFSGRGVARIAAFLLRQTGRGAG